MARLGPKSRPGDLARYTGDSEVHPFQVMWGNNDDPRGVLVDGETYTIAQVEAHSQHTKVELAGVPGKLFNTVHFEDASYGSKGVPDKTD